jgi:hypothetical protein
MNNPDAIRSASAVFAFLHGDSMPLDHGRLLLCDAAGVADHVGIARSNMQGISGQSIRPNLRMWRHAAEAIVEFRTPQVSSRRCAGRIFPITFHFPSVSGEC